MKSYSVVGEAYKVAGPARVNRAMLAMRLGNYDAALMHLRLSLRRLAESGAPDAPLSISTSLLLGDAYVKTGDKERARESYQQALRQVRAQSADRVERFAPGEPQPVNALKPATRIGAY
jgi:tetratricopeptide (TPR) repeat protein